jgi:hypothetical protein
MPEAADLALERIRQFAEGHAPTLILESAPQRQAGQNLRYNGHEEFPVFWGTNSNYL